MKISIHKCRPKDHPFPVLAWLIMMFQGMWPWHKKAYSHMAISYESISGRTKFADSTSKGVRDMVSDVFLKKYAIVDSISIEISANYNGFIDWFETIEGFMYDKLQLLGLLARSIDIITFNSMGSDLNKLTCNEVVLSLLIHFKNLEVKDTDDYDLNRTWREACKYRIGAYNGNLS